MLKVGFGEHKVNFGVVTPNFWSPRLNDNYGLPKAICSQTWCTSISLNHFDEATALVELRHPKVRTSLDNDYILLVRHP